jgi:hypothetical protein
LGNGIKVRKRGHFFAVDFLSVHYKGIASTCHIEKRKTKREGGEVAISL